MKENKTIKLSLSTFLLIIMLIVIIIMGIYIYRLNTENNEKIVSDQKVAELESQVNILNENINDLQKQLTNMSNTSNQTIDTTYDSNTTQNNRTNININLGTFSGKDITDQELDDGVFGYIDILENNEFDIPRTWRHVII